MHKNFLLPSHKQALIISLLHFLIKKLPQKHALNSLYYQPLHTCAYNSSSSDDLKQIYLDFVGEEGISNDVNFIAGVWQELM